MPPGMRSMPSAPTLVSANENVGAWDMRLAYRFPNGAGEVIVCIPSYLDQEQAHKAWYAVAKLAQDPSRVPDIDGEAHEGEIPEAIGAVEFMRGVKALVRVARAVVDAEARSPDKPERLLRELGDALEPFGDE